ncbi:MAG: Na+-transporting NADH:ubiquinone oxidoreductase subunit [Thermosipho sp. (in: thermotogales)]|nr:Na+-transporting NADH:ubiquinone oxidoreductase subunit [Thermosipho sp. (in: thermotogales)]
MKEKKLYTIIFTFVVSFVFVLILSYINFLTYDKIVENQKFSKISAVLNSMGIEYKDEKDALEIFNSTVKEIELGGLKFYVSTVNGEKVYAYVFSGNGLWGTINGVICVNENVDRIIGIDIISHNETPGLGGRIEENWFKNQFKNEKIKGEIKLVNTQELGDKDKDNSSVDAITGATLTSKFFIQIVNNSLAEIRKALRGE